MKCKRILLALVISSTILYLSDGQPIYIAPSGSDSNDGSQAKPLASLRAACDLARLRRTASGGTAKIEIIARKGEYFLTQPLILDYSDKGSEGAPLVIRGEEPGLAVFRGGFKVEGWQQTDGAALRAFIPQVAYNNSYFEQLWVNGKRATRARTPNSGFYKVKGVTETVLEKGSGRAPDLAVQKISLDSAEASAFQSFREQDFRDALVIFYHNWDNTRKRVTGLGGDKKSIYTIGQGMKPWNPINSRSRYLVENYPDALDAPGEWYLDRSGYLYYIPLPGENAGNISAFVPVLNEFITIKGDQSSDRQAGNIEFRDLVFEYAGYNTPSDGNEPEQAAASVHAVITIDFATGVTFSNCEIAHTGTYGIWFRRGVSNCLVERCYLHDLGAGGIKIGETVLRKDSSELTRHIIVNNNIITDGGHVFPCAVGAIIFHSSDNQLTHNEISNLRYSGVSAGWTWGYSFSPSKRNKIEFNHIHHLGWGELCDMGGVYTLGASEGTTVSNNVIHHVYSYDYGGWGLYTDEGSFGIIEENNLVYMCKSSGFHQHYGKENIIRNNIFAFNIRSQLQATRVEEHKSLTFANNIIYFDRGTLLSNNWNKFNIVSDRNCYWDIRNTDISFGGMSFAEWKNSGKDRGSIIADPLFVNAEGFDFHLKKKSPVTKIGFVPFEYNKAGVYGDGEWIKKARLDPELETRFDVIIKEREK